MEMNDKMRAEERWNDPAAAFLTVSAFSFGVECVDSIWVMRGAEETHEGTEET